MMKFLKDENGQGMVEYGLIIALVAIIAIAGLKYLGPAVKGKFDSATTELGGTVPSGE